jgi:hypothetical protein
MLSKWTSTHTLLWFIRSTTSVDPQTVRLSPDNDFIIFTNGINVVVKLSYATGLVTLARQFTTFEIMSGVAISPDSLNLIIGGKSDAGPRHSKMMEMDSAGFVAIQSFRHTLNQ